MKIAVIGHAGYVGSALVPALLNDGHEVIGMDRYLYGNPHGPHERLRQIKGDVRDRTSMHWAIEDSDAVIHLACISNDPSFSLNPKLAKEINYESFHHFTSAIKEKKPLRVIFASSSSVYGVKAENKVHEGLSCEPLTDYSKYKLMCEHMLLENEFPDSTVTILRPATICGYAPRLRLDVIINALTLDAITKNEIHIHGGEQIRPNLNIHDMVRAYKHVLRMPIGKINKQIYNVGGENYSVNELAFQVQNVIASAKLCKKKVSDNRSYRIDSSKIKQELDFAPAYSLRSAIESLKQAFDAGLIGDPSESRYHNLKVIKELQNEGAI